MRFSLLLIGLLLLGVDPARATQPAIDSLHSVLSRTTDPAEQIRIYRNLADVTAETPEASGYLVTLAEIARAAGQTRPMMEALTDATDNYLQQEKLDSARYYRALAKEYVPDNERDEWCVYLDMRIFGSELTGEEAAQAIDKKIDLFQSRKIGKENIYQQIEAEYVVGLSLENKEQADEAIAHFETSLELARKLPFRQGAPYQLLILRQLSRLYNATKQTQQASDFLKTSIEIKEKYYQMYDKAERPFYPMDNFYITNYASLLINIEHMPEEEIRFYLDRLVEMSDHSNNAAHKYNRFHAQFNHAAITGNLKQALIYNDSLIHYARQIATYSLPNLYRINSVLYENLGDDKRALRNLRESSRLQDSVRISTSQAKYDKLRIEYDVNKLNYEKSRLEIRNKHIMLVTLSIILFAVFGLCVFLYYHLRRERRRKEHMRQLKMQAEESEKLKTSFINSICHEIRTPLNGIVGFAELAFDPTLDEEDRRTFPDEIQRNTKQLVALIDSMLEVSNLDVSNEKIPCSQVDVVPLCRGIFEKHTQDKPAESRIETQLTLPDELVVSTNRHYLSLVLDNLLTNAYKFTREGSIALTCRAHDGQVRITVTDTGCGIPAEKRQVVFDRFIKLDIHTPGSGLGLYLCKLVIEKLSGHIYIDPDYTDGTRIVVVLPPV